jgi:hypothetical protein
MKQENKTAAIGVSYYLSYLIYGNDSYLREAQEWMLLATLVTQPYTLTFPRTWRDQQLSGYKYVSLN